MFMPSGVVAATAGILRASLTAGIGLNLIGYSDLQAFGSIIPATPKLRDNTLDGVFTNEAADIFFVEMAGNGVPDTDASWVECDVTGTYSTGAKTVTLDRASMIYDGSAGPNSRWQLNGNLDDMINAEVYAVVMR